MAFQFAVSNSQGVVRVGVVGLQLDRTSERLDRLRVIADIGEPRSQCAFPKSGVLLPFDSEAHAASPLEFLDRFPQSVDAVQRERTIRVGSGAVRISLENL